MKRCIIILMLISFISLNAYSQSDTRGIEQKIFVFGGDINQKFVQYVVDLTKKENPNICYVPTASADNVENIRYWEFICKKINLEPYVLKVWVSSDTANQSFEEILLQMDAIIVGGGNTLNMMGIWKAQGIDEILQKALSKGIILAGGSAGSICWFQNGISDSRPVNLSLVNGLSFLPYSNCPHYSSKARSALYHQKIVSREINEGYASDELSGILFVDGKFSEAISLNDVNHSYFVSLKEGLLHSVELKSKILINKGALAETDYDSKDINKSVKDFPEIDNQNNPLNAFISLKYLFANGKLSKQKQVASFYLQHRLSDTISDIQIKEETRSPILNTRINKVLIYKDTVAGIINKISKDYYGLWFFYKENGKWMSAGEDIGGETIVESEITFREKAKMHLEKVWKIIYK